MKGKTQSLGLKKAGPSLVRKKRAVALIHYPVLDRQKKQVATNITNFDIHDIARSCRVYDMDTYYIVHPMREQLMFVSRILDHWRVGEGAYLNPMRKTALTMVEPVESLDQALSNWKKGYQVVTTSAREIKGATVKSFQQARKTMENRDTLLVFGTGFGLTESLIQESDFCLEPIRGVGQEDYRHLSVRSAVGICLDRLCGQW